MLCNSSRLKPPRTKGAAAVLTASQKCLCKHTFLLRGKICLGFCLGQNHSGFAAPALCAAAQLTASQKCLCEHTFLLRGIISAGRIAMQFFTADASTHQRCGCAIDGLAKMSVQAHIFASWLNCLRRMLLCSLRGLCPQPCLRHGLGIDGLAKMPLRARNFASWYNIRRKNC